MAGDLRAAVEPRRVPARRCSHRRLDRINVTSRTVVRYASATESIVVPCVQSVRLAVHGDRTGTVDPARSQQAAGEAVARAEVCHSAGVRGHVVLADAWRVL